ncbi:MAG TPA: peptidylprolyl isomerase [Bacteroidia bacterium]|jgi:peptidylprolyl isomerase|nr:peptidylprolyl isomerase [Bacteroidia bacterium]
MKRTASFILVFFLISTAYAQKKGQKLVKEKETRILLHTDLGDMKIRLFNETPKHRDNFIKLVKDSTLNGTLFHRVIEGFMIQGGDVDSKKAAPGIPLGNGNVGYTIPAEFNPNYFHKKGALAGARESDEVNPRKESSGCQFYIVQGKTFTDSILNQLELRMKGQLLQQLFTEYINKPENIATRTNLIRLQQQQKGDSMQLLIAPIQPVLDKELEKHPYKFTEEQRNAYKTIGGAPHLDGGYTVFGEVYEGLDVVDKIAAVEKDQNDRPKKDIHVTFSFIDK